MLSADWGQLAIEGFSTIKFDENAFDHLVLEQSNKDIIRALVESTKREHYEASKLLSDVISNKGGGIIIVL